MIPNRSSPSAPIIPVLGYADVVEATNWLCEAFGFQVRLRIGTHRAQLVLNGGALMVTDAGSGEVGDRHSVHVRVEDARAHCERAEAKGARIIRPVADHPYGERQYTAEDPGGHRWTFSESIADVDPSSWGATDVNLDVE